MKKKVMLGLLSIASVAMTFTSCKKEETQVPLEPGTAIVKGRLTANLDASSFEVQTVPAGTGITFIIDGEDLDVKPNPNYQYDQISERVEVGANGEYAVTLPARKKPINAKAVFDAFEFDATIITTDDEGFQTTTVSRRVFSRVEANIQIVEGQTIVRDFAYSMEGEDFVNRATIRGFIDATFTDNFGDVTGISKTGTKTIISGTDNDTLLTTGSGYVTANNVAVTGGTGSGMTVNFTAEQIGIVKAVSLLNAGTGYWNGTYGTTTTGDGTGLQLNVTTDAGNVTAVTVPSWAQGTGYAAGQIVTIVGGNNDATVQITEVTEGKVLSVTLNNAGENYTVGDVVTISGGTNATFAITEVSPYKEAVPENVVVSFITNNGNGETYRTTTDVEGKYIIQVPVTQSNGMETISIRPATFEYETTYLEDGEFVTEPRIYSVTPISQTVYVDDIKERNITYLRNNN